MTQFFEDISEEDRRRFELEGLKVFSTEYFKRLESGRVAKFEAYIVAEDWKTAEKHAPEGHTVKGEVVKIIPAPEMDQYIEAEQGRRDREWADEAGL